MTDKTREAVERLADRLDKGATWAGDWKHEAADMIRALLARAETAERELAEVVAAAVKEYGLHHVHENSDERLGRHAAIRGLMVRLDLYSELEAALAQEGET